MRKKRLIRNTYAALINQIVTFICGLILPRQILVYFGSEVNGLVTSITQFLGFVTLMDMGIGAVVQSNLYKPLVQNDRQAINRIITSAGNFFKKITIVLLVYTLVLMVFYPIYIDKSLGHVSTVLLILAISISTMAQYLFGITNQMILSADQKSYVFLLPASVVTVLNLLVSVILFKQGVSLTVVKFCSAGIMLLKPAAVAIYVKKHYFINRREQFEEEPIKQKWNALAQHVATFVVDKTDIVVLTLLSTLVNVSIYQIYHLVVLGLCQIFSMITTGIQSLLGDMYAKNETEKLRKTYSMFEWISHVMVTIMFGCAGVLMQPFVRVYTEGINDAEYINPTFSWLITIAFALYCLRTFYNILVKAAGHYKETQNSAIMEAALNIVISVICVKSMGLVGVAIGTLAAVLFRMIYLMLYTNKKLVTRKGIVLVKQYATDVLIFCLIVLLTGGFKLGEADYISWGVLALKTGIIACLISLIVNVIFFKSRMQEMFGMIRLKNSKDTVL